MDKNELKVIHNPNIRAKAVKLLEENCDINLCDPKWGHGFLGTSEHKQKRESEEIVHGN